jgi:hypothetical protein
MFAMLMLAASVLSQGCTTTYPDPSDGPAAQGRKTTSPTPR